MTKLRNYLRFYRRKSALTQEELAFLLGYQHASAVSRCEWQERALTLGPAFAYQLIFGVDLPTLLPALFEQVEEEVLRRIHELYERIAASNPTQASAAKLALLKEALARLANGATQDYEPQSL